MKRNKRVFAVDPTPKGFGWIVFEGPDRIIDWGIAYVQPINNARCLRRLGALLDQYPPDVFVLEELPEVGSRRSVRGQQLIVSMEKAVKDRGHTVKRFSRETVRSVFEDSGAWNKDQIAREIAERYRELSPWLPPVRKIWMSEDHRMAIFDAAALAITYFSRRKRRRSAAGERVRRAA